MNTYIVRIYREEQNNPRAIAGLVEEVGRDGKRGFTNYDELWKILNAAKRDDPQPGKKRA